jgi:hypothetical protein
MHGSEGKQWKEKKEKREREREKERERERERERYRSRSVEMRSLVHFRTPDRTDAVNEI